MTSNACVKKQSKACGCGASS